MEDKTGKIERDKEWGMRETERKIERNRERQTDIEREREND